MGKRLAQTGGNLRAMKTAILDKNFVGASAGDNNARKIDTGNSAFQRLRIEGWGAVGSL